MKEISKNTFTLLFILLAAILSVIAFISYDRVKKFNNSVDWVIHSHAVKDNIVELRSNIKDAEISQRGYLITNDSVFLQPYTTAEQHSKLVFATLDSLVSDNVWQQENLKKLKTLFDERYLMLNDKLKLFKSNTSTNLLTDSLMHISQNKMDQVGKQIALMLQTEDKVLEQRIQVKDRSATITPIFLLLLSLFSIVALTFFFFRLQKETILRVSTEKLVEAEKLARKQIEAVLKEISDYKYALDASSIVAITDHKGIIKYVNDNFCTISKYTLLELIGQDHRIISSGYHTKAFIRNIWTTIANGKLWKGELKNKAKDGTIYWVDTTIVPFLDELGKPYQYVAIRSDITEQKEVEEKLLESEKMFKSIFDNSLAAIMVADDQGNYLSANKAASELLGYPVNELLQMNVGDLKTSAKPGAAKRYEEYISKGEEDGEFDFITKNGARKFGQYQATHLKADFNISIMMDITEKKEAEEKVRILNTHLEEKVKIRTQELDAKNTQLGLANAELASFTYIASHDLKEPLRKIHTFARRILETETFSDKTLDYFNRIILSGARMQDLIDSLLDLSSVNSAELIFEPCDLNTIVEESKNDLQIIVLEKQAIIEHENLPVIMGARIQIFQLITNLLGNAIKYSRPGTTPHIKITSSVVDGKTIEHTSANKQTKYHAIKITDNGIGFEQEYANKIFEPFQRLHAKNEYSGTGIGLVIVKKTVTNHKGFIIAEGKPNIGSTFTIYLPIA